MNQEMLGRLRAVTVVCPDFDASTAAYREYLGYRLAEAGRIPVSLAAAWGAPSCAGARYEWLLPECGGDVGLRLIDGASSPIYRPYASWGWNAIELSVSDCDRAVAQLSEGPFRIVGPPADLSFADGALRAGQLVGPAGEVLYLNQIKRAVPGFELPAARCLVDRPFIVILHAADAASGIAAYRERFGNVGSDTFEMPVEFMAEYQDSPRDHAYRLGTVTLAGGSYFEIDGAPPHIGARRVTPGALPAGIAMVSVESSVAAGGPYPPGSLYGGRAVSRIEGVAGEWLELISPV